MGWKNVKEHYGIKHVVQVQEKGICIGSPYIHDIIVIGTDGVLKKRCEQHGYGNSELLRYMQDFNADPDKLKKLVLSEDRFDANVKVYTYDDGGDIVEKLCEVPGWPNATHDGQIMFDNTFSLDREEVREWAIENAEAGVKITSDRIEEKKQELREMEERLIEHHRDLQKLKADMT